MRLNWLKSLHWIPRYLNFLFGKCKKITRYFLVGGWVPHQKKQKKKKNVCSKFPKKNFKSFQIYVKDLESAESKEKSNFSFSNFYFSSYGHFCDVITPIFDEFFTITQGGVCISLVGTGPEKWRTWIRITRYIHQKIWFDISFNRHNYCYRIIRIWSVIVEQNIFTCFEPTSATQGGCQSP